MNSKLSKFAKVAAIGLALTFTLSCSSGSDDNGGGTSSPSNGGDLSSSSIGGGDGSSSSATGGGGGSSSSSVGGGSSSSATGGGNSSSSVGGGTACTAADNTDTQYCSNGTMKTYGSTPSIGGRTYKTIEIGNKVWMAENLNYDVPDNETDVCYDNDPANCTTYGRLYNWETANTVCLSVSGWHLPSDAEWTMLTDFISNNAETLRTTSGWKLDGNGTDNFGFSALPGGYYDNSEGRGFREVGYIGIWWTAMEYSNTIAIFRQINFSNVWREAYAKYFALSVRCVKD